MWFHILYFSYTFLFYLLSILFVYYTLYFPYTVFMYCSYTIFIYLYSCTFHFLYCFPVILFIWLSLLCTCICCHILSYDIHILCSLYVFRILCFSYTVIYSSLSCSYTFMYYVLFIYCHISYTAIFYFTSCSCNCLYFHRITVLCYSYHVIYSIHAISF